MISGLEEQSYTQKKRFTYENAQDTIDQNKGEFLEELVNLNRIAKHHRKKRFENGSFNFKSNEVKFQLDEKKETDSNY